MIKSIPETRIDKKAIKAWRLSAMIFGAFWFSPSIGYILIALNIDNFEPFIFVLITVPSLILYLLISVLFPKLKWQRWRYDINEDSIDLLRGFIFKTRTVIPINRIQHVDTNQGPIYRKYSLSSVKVSTAATTHEIPALSDDIADEVRNKITELVRQVKEDV